jgi:hypothetical protein
VIFTGMLLLPIWHGVKSYLSDMSESGAAAGALACSFIAFTTNRLVLSERENHMLIFSLLAIVVFLNYQYAKERVTERRSYRSPRKGYYRTEGIGPKAADTAALAASRNDPTPTGWPGGRSPD